MPIGIDHDESHAQTAALHTLRSEIAAVDACDITLGCAGCTVSLGKAKENDPARIKRSNSHDRSGKQTEGSRQY